MVLYRNIPRFLVSLCVIIVVINAAIEQASAQTTTTGTTRRPQISSVTTKAPVIPIQTVKPTVVTKSAPIKPLSGSSASTTAKPGGKSSASTTAKPGGKSPETKVSISAADVGKGIDTVKRVIENLPNPPSGFVGWVKSHWILVAVGGVVVVALVGGAIWYFGFNSDDIEKGLDNATKVLDTGNDVRQKLNVNNNEEDEEDEDVENQTVDEDEEDDNENADKPKEV